jgi:hypothetical protein
MNRVWTLTLFLVRDLFRSLAGIVPVAIALAFGLIAFQYGMDQAQFFTVAGVGTGLICSVTTLLLSSRANRAISYPLLARLHRRSELLAAPVVGSLIITAVLAALIAVANLLIGRLVLDFPSALWIVPTWLPLWLLAATLALPLSTLVSRGGSHLVGYALLLALLLVNEKNAPPPIRRLQWLIRLVGTILWPPITLLSRASAGVHDQTYLFALLLTLGYAVLLFGLATQIFVDKDLLWTE